jgi:GntR family transcriptional regulator
MPAQPTATAPQGRDKLHLQLARLFRNKIATDAWPVGSAIPTVQELEALHGVSRTTVRMALGALVAEGLLLTRKRGGTRVIAAPYRPPSFLLPTSWKDLVAFGERIGQITVRTEEGCLPPIPEGFPAVGRLAPAYVHLLRVHTHGGARFCLSELYLEQQLYPEIEAQLQRSTLAGALGNDPARIARARQHLSVAPADELAAEHLGVALGTPLMQALRWASNAQGLLVYWAKVRFLSEYVHMEMDLLQ